MDAYLALGSNLGDRQHYLRSAIKALQMTEGITVVQESPVFETAAVGYTNQPDFLNMALHIKTTLTPEKLLERALAVETELGRVREIKWGPRTIDIDVLFYGRLIINTETLIVPHPFLHERAFVLLPLRDIAPDWVHPLLRITVHEMAEQVSGKEGVHRWEKPLVNDCVHIEN
jgi:2-amino-4-hydroxy-6-hydroxymethyldihydropteridine diphosphokinase